MADGAKPKPDAYLQGILEAGKQEELERQTRPAVTGGGWVVMEFDKSQSMLDQWEFSRVFLGLGGQDSMNEYQAKMFAAQAKRAHPDRLYTPVPAANAADL